MLERERDELTVLQSMTAVPSASAPSSSPAEPLAAIGTAKARISHVATLRGGALPLPTPSGPSNSGNTSVDWDSFDERVLLEPMPDSSSSSVNGPPNTEAAGSSQTSVNQDPEELRRTKEELHLLVRKQLRHYCERGRPKWKLSHSEEALNLYSECAKDIIKTLEIEPTVSDHRTWITQLMENPETLKDLYKPYNTIFGVSPLPALSTGVGPMTQQASPPRVETPRISQEVLWETLQEDEEFKRKKIAKSDLETWTLSLFAYGSPRGLGSRRIVPSEAKTVANGKEGQDLRLPYQLNPPVDTKEAMDDD
ncbi:hypothetical protein TEA_018914 [Camellia sinensis var. sinensis]|uniref:Uncharacterized protein n=1 Tax=Camellia sinensis var. sinensis TaxID=542762 RepID=A0A4S4EDE9_CAMSN|nr:hypothetical protein TEA_018914 [Camellia sinensis var. sinensis]